MKFASDPPIASVSASSVDLLGWQYPRFVPSFCFPTEMTAYVGVTLARNGAVVDVLLP